jgi:hypothetical protein
MLQFNEIVWIDITPYLISGEQPIYMLQRPKAHSEPKAWAGSTQIACLGEFWVPQGPVFGGEQAWSVTKTGDMVRVPVFAYKVPRSLASIWGMALQIGLAAVADLRHHTNDIPSEVTLVLGSDCTDLSPMEEMYRCYAGIAIRTK